MWFAAKAKSSTESWGRGFLFVFLPEDDKAAAAAATTNPHGGGIITNKKTINNHHHHHHFYSSPKHSIAAFLKRTNSYHLLSTAQSTISICALLFFITLLLFTLSTFEPTSQHHHHYRLPPRRQLSSTPLKLPLRKHGASSSSSSHALQGMGKLYRRGTKAMNDLIVAHGVETLTSRELRLFLRLLHRSGLTSRSDLLFISSSSSSISDNTIVEENDSFSRLIELYSKEVKNVSESTRPASFDGTQFVKPSKKEKDSKEPIWGMRIRANSSAGNATELTRTSYGSVVSFDVNELDPENALGGFLDHVPMSLRRWACYPMLLGRLRRNFKHVMLVDAKEILLLGDPLGRVRRSSPETIYLSIISQLSSGGKHNKKNSGKTQLTQHKRVVNPAIIMGGARGVRRLSKAMLTEIARAAMQQPHKKKNPVTELGLFNQLVGNENLLKNVNLITATESVPELSSLTELKSKSGSHHLPMSKFTVIRRGNNNNVGVDSAIMKRICSSPLDSKVYRDC